MQLFNYYIAKLRHNKTVGIELGQEKRIEKDLNHLLSQFSILISNESLLFSDLGSYFTKKFG